MENRVRERTLFLLLTEKIDLDEVSINWLSKIPIIGKAFDREAEQDAESGNKPVETGESVKAVTIPIPYPDEKKANVLQDTEVIKLLNSFYAVWDITNKQARDHFAKALSADPTSMIKRFLSLAGVDNKATKDDESGTDIKPADPDNPTPDPEDSSPRANSNKVQTILQVLKDRSADEEIGELIDRHVTNWARKEYSASPSGAKDFMYNIKTSLDYIKKELGNVLTKSLKENKSFSLSKITVLFLETMHDVLFQEQLAITNLAETDVAELVNEINKFYPYAKEYLGFDRPVELTLISDPDNAKDTFGKTAYYSPANEQMTIFVDGRHPKDIIRSFSHELVHHAQNCRGEFDRDFNVGENYIETDDHLKEMEREAYDKGNMCLRTYESYLKKENKVMKEKTLRKAIREAIKRVVENKTTEEAVEEAHCGASKRDYMEEDTVTEDSGEEEAWHQWKNEHADDDHIKEIEHHLRALRGDRDHERDEAEYDHDKYEDEGMEETADKNTGMSGLDGDDNDDTYMGHMKEDEDYTAKKEKPGDDKRKGAEKRGAEGTLAKTKGHGKVDYVNEEEGLEEDEDYTAKKEKPGDDKRKGAEKRGAEGTLAKTKGHGKVDYVNEEETTTSLNESMAVKKGQIVFDKLVKKWCK